MAALYANENFPLQVVLRLRSLGHDVLTLQETDHGGQAMADDDVLAFATQSSRILLTLNRKHFRHRPRRPLPQSKRSETV